MSQFSGWYPPDLQEIADARECEESWREAEDRLMDGRELPGVLFRAPEEEAEDADV